MPRKMDDIRSPFEKRYKYKEHSSCHSFQLNDVLIKQNIFAFVCMSPQGGAGKPGNLENPDSCFSIRPMMLMMATMKGDVSSSHEV